jgi:hypothetical protein
VILTEVTRPNALDIIIIQQNSIPFTSRYKYVNSILLLIGIKYSFRVDYFLGGPSAPPVRPVLLHLVLWETAFGGKRTSI